LRTRRGCRGGRSSSGSPARAARRRRRSRAAACTSSRPTALLTSRPAGSATSASNSDSERRRRRCWQGWISSSRARGYPLSHRSSRRRAPPPSRSVATAAARAADVPYDAIAHALRSFPGVPHRLELVRELRGVRWINDSKATNTAAARRGIAAYEAPLRLILGGSLKGEDFGPFARDL